MKFKTTQKAIKNNFAKIIIVPYCGLQHIFSAGNMNPIAYTTRAEGWAADIYDCGGGVAIVTGYAPFGNIRPAYEVVRRYDDAARKLDVWNDENRAKAREMLRDFVGEVVG